MTKQIDLFDVLKARTESDDNKHGESNIEINKKSFFNTIHLSGDALVEAIKNAKEQESAIFLIFSSSGQSWTASEITKKTEEAGRGWPIWSNRRAITNLKTKGKIIKLIEMRDGPHGKPEHLYLINKT